MYGKEILRRDSLLRIPWVNEPTVLATITNRRDLQTLKGERRKRRIKGRNKKVWEGKVKAGFTASNTVSE